MNRQAVSEEIINLMYHVMRQLNKHEVVEPVAVNAYQLHTLYLLTQQPRTMSELAEALAVTLPSTTAMVNRLVEHGWVERRADAHDRRVVHLHLKEAGRVALRKAKAARYRKLKALLDAMQEADVATLHRIFSNLNQKLTETKEEHAHKSIKT